MPRPRKAIPTYRHHKPTNQARSTVDGKDYWHGVWDSPESKRKYAEFLDKHARGVLADPAPPPPMPFVSIDALCLKFVADQFKRYVRADGKESAECDCYRGVIKILSGLFGQTPIDEFGPLRLRRCREAMVEAAWSRGYINKQVGRLRRIFRWGVSWELVPQVVADALKSVEGLRPGDSTAPELPAREAVPMEHIEIIKTRMRQRTKDLVDLLIYTGARPGELVSVRPCDIDMRKKRRKDGEPEIWVANLAKHKNAWRGQRRTLYFGPRSQLILRRYLGKGCNPKERIFPVSRHTLSLSIAAACERHGIPRFTAHHLRHTAATLLRDELGIEYAQAMLGHKRVDQTASYSIKSEKKAITAAKKLG